MPMQKTKAVVMAISVQSRLTAIIPPRTSQYVEAGTGTGAVLAAGTTRPVGAETAATVVLPASVMPCSRYGRGWAGKKVARQAGQLLLVVSQVTMHDDPSP